MPFLPPNQQRQSTEGKKCHTPRTCSPQAHLGVFHPSLNHVDCLEDEAEDYPEMPVLYYVPQYTILHEQFLQVN